MRQTQEAWHMHPRRLVVDNGAGGFQAKLAQVVEATRAWLP
jgi:hypothetical protein